MLMINNLRIEESIGFHPMRLDSRGPQGFIAGFVHFRLNASDMRAVIQRVGMAEVATGGTVSGAIGQGLLVLVAVEESDSREDIEWLSGKIVRLRVFNDAGQVMNRSVREIGGGVLVVSQFTLFASTRKGNRPSYSRAARPEMAVPLYEALLRQLATDLGRPIEAGIFGADMRVSLINDGPVTIVIDSKLRE
jgi:D-aminoacyl-tRNA deacylase